MKSPFFSPSEYHQNLLKNNKPSMGFSENDLGENFKSWKNKLKKNTKKVLGEMPTDKVDLNVRPIWKKDTELGAIEKIVFTSEPFADVPAYVCIPHKAKAPYTFFLCVQGHSTGMHNSIGVQLDDESKMIEVEGDRDFAISCMENGYGALCIEQRAFGEREENKQRARSPNRCHDATMQALMLGKTLLGERVYDIDRGIDYLLSRGDVDPKRIGVMGNSGGGTATLFAAAILPRISFAMPSCYFCTFRDSIMSIHHCADNYVPGLLKIAEMSDVMGLFAPKPLVIVAGKEDDIFPVSGTKKAFKELQKIYAAAGAKDQCKLVIGDGGHRFYADKAWKAMNRLIAQNER